MTTAPGLGLVLMLRLSAVKISVVRQLEPSASGTSTAPNAMLNFVPFQQILHGMMLSSGGNRWRPYSWLVFISHSTPLLPFHLNFELLS